MERWNCNIFFMYIKYTFKHLTHTYTYTIVHYDTSAIKLFLTSVSLQHEPKASDIITLVKKTFPHECHTKFYIMRRENADFCTRSVCKTAIYTRSNIKYILCISLMYV